jgi:aryl-alcohol dehydrogenase-like predicted oxidoreductase
VRATGIESTDLRLGALGLGCVTFGREIDQAASFAMMDHAVAHGITSFDTASAYGGGASERIVGAWLAQRRPPPNTILVATKLLPPYSPASLREGMAQSRQRLGLDTLDLLYLHRWDPTVSAPAVLETLGGFVRDGTVRALGASNFTAEQLEQAIVQQRAAGLPTFRVLQNIHNFAVEGIDGRQRAICQREKVAIVTYSPLGAGFLSGKHHAGVAAGSRFAIIPGHQNIYFHEQPRRRLAELERIAAESKHPPTLLALAWAMHQPGIASVLIGGRNTGHIDQALAALAFDPRELFAKLDSD